MGTLSFQTNVSEGGRMKDACSVHWLTPHVARHMDCPPLLSKYRKVHQQGTGWHLNQCPCEMPPVQAAANPPCHSAGPLESILAKGISHQRECPLNAAGELACGPGCCLPRTEKEKKIPWNSTLGLYEFGLSQVAKLPPVVQQQTPVAGIQQVASASQQVGHGLGPSWGSWDTPDETIASDFTTKSMSPWDGHTTWVYP